MTAIGGVLVLFGYMAAPEGPSTPIPLWWKMVTFGGFLLASGLGAVVGAADAKFALEAAKSDKENDREPSEVDRTESDDDEGLDETGSNDDGDNDDDTGVDLSRNDLMHQ